MGKRGRIPKQLLDDQFLYERKLLANSQEIPRGNPGVCGTDLKKSALENKIHVCRLQPK
jgi:hypothetical protein